MSIRSCFSTMLYEYRTEGHLRQRDVADLCGVSLRHYQELEIGRSLPSLTTAVRIAAALNFSLDALKDEVDAIDVPLSGD